MKTNITKKISAVLLAGSAFMALSSAQAYEAGDWIIRAGPAGVYPTGDGKIDGIDGAKVEADSAWSLGINFTYMATDNIGLELLAAWPFTHDIECKGSISALGTCAETKHLPPTFTVQYHFDTGSKWHPFLGAGLNYTYFFDEKTKGDLKSLNSDLSLKSSWGLALEAGLDYELTDNWLIGAQVYWMDIDTEATLEIDDLNFRSSGNDVSIDPWVYMFSVGYKF